jgi:hypothetical protein
MTKLQKKGIWYENKLRKHLRLVFDGTLRDHSWILSHSGYRQPDFVLEYPDRVLVLEAKLSFREGAIRKLRTVYGPLVSRLYPDKLVVLVQVTAFTRGRNTNLAFLDDLLNLEPQPAVHLWHWSP